MTKLTFYYFPVKSRGESIRLALDYCGIEYEDKVIESKDFAQNYKKNFPFKQMPVLELEDGNMIAHSNAILLYIAKIGGLSTGDAYKSALINQVMMQCHDMLSVCFSYGYCKPEDKQFMLTFLKNKLPSMLDDLSKFIEKNADKGFAVGNKITIADFCLHLVLQLLKDYELYDMTIDGMKENQEPISSVYKTIMSTPSLKSRTQHYIQ